MCICFRLSNPIFHENTQCLAHITFNFKSPRKLGRQTVNKNVKYYASVELDFARIQGIPDIRASNPGMPPTLAGTNGRTMRSLALVRYWLQ